MKKIFLLALSLLLCFPLAACSTTTEADIDHKPTPRTRLVEGNTAYVAGQTDPTDISQTRRTETAQNGQSPFAIIVTCSDSRVIPEAIFNCGLGELFVIRTAGNVIGDFELGTIEYGYQNCGAKLLVVMGHTHCGAVKEALSGQATGYIQTLLEEIQPALQGQTEASICEELNVKNSLAQINRSGALRLAIDRNDLTALGAIYDIESGKVRFLD